MKKTKKPGLDRVKKNKNEKFVCDHSSCNIHR